VDGKMHSELLSAVVFSQGDTLVLQVSSDSPLLEMPPQQTTTQSAGSRLSSFFRSSATSLDGLDKAEISDPEDNLDFKIAAWNDLEVIHMEGSNDREFMTAMRVAKKSNLIGGTLAKGGIDKLPGLHLVSLERPTTNGPFETLSFDVVLEEGDIIWFVGAATAIGDLRKIPVSPWINMRKTSFLLFFL
jgi:hypothetical protein